MLVSLCLAVSVAEIDVTIVNVALPSLAQALGTTSTELA
jgi:DHA2 family multidrug resistance protein-like MFS transporter